MQWDIEDARIQRRTAARIPFIIQREEKGSLVEHLQFEHHGEMIAGNVTRGNGLEFGHFLMARHRDRSFEAKLPRVEKDVIDDIVETRFVVRVSV